MARKNREWYPNVAYHINTRGNHKYVYWELR
jgi:hypothetical protein